MFAFDQGQRWLRFASEGLQCPTDFHKDLLGQILGFPFANQAHQVTVYFRPKGLMNFLEPQSICDHSSSQAIHSTTVDQLVIAAGRTEVHLLF